MNTANLSDLISEIVKAGSVNSWFESNCKAAPDQMQFVRQLYDVVIDSFKTDRINHVEVRKELIECLAKQKNILEMKQEADRDYNSRIASIEKILLELSDDEARVIFLSAELEQVERAIKSNNSVVHLNSNRALYVEKGIKLTKYIQNKIQELEPAIVTRMQPELDKIRWMGSPEQFGYIFGQLVSKGYIELPTQEGEGTFSKLAELCLQYFEIPISKTKKKGTQTTKNNLERAINPKTNILNLKGKTTLRLPSCNDLK